MGRFCGKCGSGWIVEVAGSGFENLEPAERVELFRGMLAVVLPDGCECLGGEPCTCVGDDND